MLFFNRRDGVARLRGSAAAGLAFLLLLDKPCQAQGRVFRSAVDGVTVGVSVRSSNRSVTGLTGTDFELTDNGVRQDLTTIAPEMVPIDLTLLLDLSSSVDGVLLQRLKTAVADTAALLRDEDRIRLVAVSQVLREVFGFRARSGVLPLDSLVAEGATSLYDGIAATMMRSTEPGRRQLIVAFTDGRDSTSIIDEATAREIARQTDAVVDIVVPVPDATTEAGPRRLSQRSGSVDALPGGNLSAGARDPQGRAEGQAFPRVLSDLVGPTAGQVFPIGPTDSLSRVFKAMLDDFRASYVLQYVPQGVHAEGWHEVAVTVRKHPKYDIRARKGYKGRSTISSSEVIR
ncbi:MAG: VWA domain-containing protein [Vicinamibacterales bacterium]